MPVEKGALKPGARLTVRMIKDLYDVLDGTITDTDVTLGRNLTVRGSLSTVGNVNQVAPGPNNVPLSVMGAPGQVANLFEARNSVGDLLFAINAGGTLVPVRISDFSLAQHNHTLATSGGLLGGGAFGGIEALYTGTAVTTAVSYTVAANVLYVFTTAAVTITLPAAASTNRPIEVIAVTGASTVVSAGGSVIGGSINVTNGTVMNGTVSAGDAITFKSDGTAWRAI